MPATPTCPGTRASAGGRSRAEGLQPLPWGKATPRCSWGSPGTRRCLHAFPVPAPHHGDMRRRAPCSCTPWINAGGLFAVCFLVTSVTWTLAPHRPWCESPSSLPARQGKALLVLPGPSLGDCQSQQGSGRSCPQGAEGVTGLTTVLGHSLEGAECCGQGLKQSQEEGWAPHTHEQQVFSLVFSV